MKKLFTTVLLFAAFALSVRADLIWYEGFNYPNGNITNTSGGVWITHSSSGNVTGAAFVNNDKLEVSSSSGGNGLAPVRQDDIHRNFATVAGSSYTNAQQLMYASFTVNFTNLPSANGQYFAHFGLGSTTFEGKLWALAGNPTQTTNNFPALPNTFRLGVTAANSGGPTSKIFPVDLALNTDYQVVLGWDPVTLDAVTLWVNPLSSADTSITSGDAFSPTTANIASWFGFRQASGFGGFLTVSNLAIATTFDEAATNVWSTNAIAPWIVYAPQGRTNFVGDNFNLTAVANGQGLATLTYQWLKNNANYSNPNGNSNVLAFSNAQITDSGDYALIVTNAYGLSVTSAVASIWVTNPPIPPTFTLQPSNQTVYLHQNATFTVAAAGSGPTYQWYLNNSQVVAGANFSDPTQPTLIVTDVQPNNGTTGTFRCDASNIYGTRTGSNAVLSVLIPPVTNIAYLRTLVDPTTFLPTNKSAYWTVSGVVTTHTNLTGLPNLSIAIQDSTAGIGVFMTSGIGAGINPQTGDNITVTGPLSDFNGTLQFNLSASDISTTITTNSSNNPLPAPIVLPLTFTNGVGFGGVSNIFRKYMSSLVMFTNVYFTDGPGTYGSGQITEIITNSNGDTFRLFFNAATTPVVTGQPIPEFAWTVTGVLVTFLSPTTVDRSSGFELDPTLYSDYVTTAPAQTTGAIALVSSKPTVTWAVQPNMSYSIYSSTNVEGPYLPLATGLTFNSAATTGQFIDANAGSSAMFYKIVSP